MKGIKTILGALAAASLLFSFSANAQENANRDENGKIVRGAYETNKAFDNVFIGVGAGVNTVLENGKWGHLGLATDLNVGKWWTPAVGMRIGWHGLANEPRIVEQFDATSRPHVAFNYFHGDFLWNISNSIGGYKETRFWDFIPYVSAGGLVVGNGEGGIKNAFKNKELAVGAGLINELRLSDRVNLNIELGAIASRAGAFNAKEAENIWIGFPTATLGLSFNLGKTNFDRHTSITPVVIPVPFTTEQYNALKDKVAALEKENAELKDKIAALEDELAPYKNLVDGQTYLYENGKFTAVDVTAANPVSVYFDCGSAKLSDREKAHLEYFTNSAVNGDTKLVVNGYADKQTGSAKRNQQLSEQRVKTVVDALVKAGANEDNIETAAHGSSVQPFEGAAKNRVVTIETK